MKLLHLILFTLIAVPVMGQGLLKGKVYDENNRGIPAASVFINNTSVGTTTDEQGWFQLQVPPGRITIIVSSIGYETFSLPMQFTPATGVLTVRLQPTAKELDNVMVEPYEKDGWEKWGRFFLENFIGTSEYAKDCRIKNPEVLRFRNSKKLQELTVHALAPLVIENRALGYWITYHLESFSYNFNTRHLLYHGFPYFRNIQGTAARQKKWGSKRDEVYEGSMMHFMRALYRNQLQAEGFEVRKLYKKSMLSNQLLQVGSIDSISSVNGTGKEPALKQQDHDLLVNELLPGDSIAYATDSATAVLDFEHYLQITYTKKMLPQAYEKRFFTNGSAMASQITLLYNRPVAVQSNGMFYEPTDLLTMGYWGWSEKIATLLPFDFQPKKSISITH